MPRLDFFVIAVYIAAVIYLGIRGGLNQSLDLFLTNNRSTKFLLLWASTISTIVGAGAIIGTSAEASRTGISYGIMVIVTTLVNLFIFALLAGKIRLAAARTGAVSTGDFLRIQFGPKTQRVYCAGYSLVAALWTAVQFVGLAALLQSLFGISPGVAILIAYAITVSYCVAGGLRADILTDFLQFWVMVIAFLILVPGILERSGGLAVLSALPERYFDVSAFGGWFVLAGSIIIGGVFPIAQAHDWLRINAAESDEVARKSLLWAMPMIVAFVGAAVLLGLLGAVVLPGQAGEIMLFSFFDSDLPPGIRGLAYASMLAVVMSSIDSLMLGGAVTLNSLAPEGDENGRLYRLKIVLIAFAAVCALVAYLFPNIVNLAVSASFVSLALAPAILLGLMGGKRSDTQASLSLLLGVAAVVLSTPFLGLNSFAAGVVCALLPLTWKSKGERKACRVAPEALQAEAVVKSDFPENT